MIAPDDIVYAIKAASFEVDHFGTTGPDIRDNGVTIIHRDAQKFLMPYKNSDDALLLAAYVGISVELSPDRTAIIARCTKHDIAYRASLIGLDYPAATRDAIVGAASWVGRALYAIRSDER